MTDEITVEMYDKTSGSVVDKVVYSIEEYANKLLKNDANSSEMKALVKSMLNYGAAAQTQFGYHTENLANKNLDEADKNVGEIGDALNATCENQRVTAADYMGFSLVLDSETALKLYFTGNSDDITLEKDGQQVEVARKESNGASYVKVENITANHLGDVYTVKKGTESVGEISALTYCYQVANANGKYGENLTNLANALYDYNQKALAFKQSQSSGN